MTNWKKLIRELRAAQNGRHMTKQAIADALGVHVNTLREIEQGRTSQPRYELGVKLIELHRDRAAR